MGGGEWIEFPCKWVKGLDKLAEKETSGRDLLYIFFHREGPRLKGNFHTNREMQKISKELLVFVDVVVKSRPKGKTLEFLKRCKVKKLPTAAITDKHGNLLYPRVSYMDPKRLHLQVRKAKANAKKLDELLTSRLERAREYCKDRKYSSAAKALAQVKKQGYVGLSQVTKINTLYEQINTYLERRLGKILGANATVSKKREALRSLRSETYKELPVYAKITKAYKEVG